MHTYLPLAHARWPRLALTALVAMSCVAPVTATVVMNGTRFVYRAGEKEITVKVSNVGKLPALTQAWIDDGDATSTPEMVDVPFNLTPPIARVEAGKSQTLRLAFTGGELPEDHESQFWINVLEVPPKPDDAKDDRGVMQLAFRYRLKLFYRPKGLPGSPDAAAGALSWKASPGGGISVSNDSAFHVTINDIKVKLDGKALDPEPFALAPRGVYTVPGTEPVAADSGVEIDFQTINDYGGFVRHSATLTQ